MVYYIINSFFLLLLSYCSKDNNTNPTTNIEVFVQIWKYVDKTYPNIIIIGVTTDGASANPAQIYLPNGWQFRVYIWQAESLNHILIEDNGIPPDKYILITENSIIEGKDLILEKANEILDTD